MNKDHLVFDSKSESFFYSQCVERYVLSNPSAPKEVIECGSGDGLPIIRALQSTGYSGSVTSYEINEHAYKSACENIQQYQFKGRYEVLNQSFFDEASTTSKEFLISDPPFLPSLSDKMIDPLLRGGNNGNEFTLKLIDCDFEEMILLVPSYTDPIGTLTYAREKCYDALDYMVAPMKLTFYSKDTEVYRQLKTLEQQGKAFFNDDIFFLAGVHFKKSSNVNTTQYDILQRVLTTNMHA